MLSSGFRFSRQEEKVLALSVTGLSDKEIANRMGIGLGTVRTFWKRIRAKAGGSSRSEVLASISKLATTEELEGLQEPNVHLLSEISRRQAAEEAASRHQLEVRLLASLIPGVAFTVSDGLAEVVDGEGQAPFPAKLPVEELWKRVHLGDQTLLRSHWLEAQRNRQRFELELRLRSPEGLYTRYSLQMAPQGDAKDRWIGVFHLISQDKASENQLPVADFHRLAFERARVGVAVVGPDSRIAVSNGRFSELLGRTESELKGEDIKALVTFSDRKRLEAALSKADVEGDAQTGLAMTQGNGGLIPVLLDVSSVREGERVTSRVVTVRRTADTARRY